MPIRKVKQHSERGSIKDLSTRVEEEAIEHNLRPSDVRLQKLIGFAQENGDKNLQQALGFITTDYIHDKNALPLSVYRIRKIVADIKAVSASKIDNLQHQFEGCFTDEVSPEAKAFWSIKKRIKTASKKSSIFRRVG